MSGMRRILLLAVAQSAVLAALTPPAVVGLSLLAQRWASAAEAPVLLSVAIACGSIAAMVSNPLFGRLVDRTPSRFGGRRPWLVLGAAGGLAGSAWVASASGPLEVTLAWVMTQACYNACFAAVNGLVSVGLPPEDRTRAAGVLTAVAYIGTLPGLAVAALFPTDLVLMTVLLPIVALVATTAVALSVTDRVGAQSPVAPRGELRALVSRPFVIAFVVRVALGAELTAGLIYGLYLFQDRWSMPVADAVRWVSLTTLAGAAGLVTAAIVLALVRSARAQPAALLGIALLGTCAAMLGRGFAPTPVAFLVASIVAGASIGIGSAVTRAIAQGTLPHDRAAFGLGVFNVAGTGAAVVAPIVASGFLAAGTALSLDDPYRAYYVLFAVPLLLLLIPLVRDRGRLRAAAGAAPAETLPSAAPTSDPEPTPSAAAPPVRRGDHG